MSSFIVNLFAQTTATHSPVTGVDPSAQPPIWIQFAPYLLLPLLVYFLFLRPQSTARKQQEDLIKSAKTGDKIVTTGGIFGLISNVKDTTVILKIADNVKIEIEKSHIARVIKDEADAKTTAK